MKLSKTLLVVLILLVCSNVNAQFSDDFESGNLNNWVFEPAGNASYNERTVSNTVVASGDFSCKIDGNSNHYEGLTAHFAQSQPTDISVKMRSEDVQNASGYFVVGKANADNMFNPHIIFAFFTSGNLRILGGNAAVYTQPAQNNTWYKLDFKNIDFEDQTYDVYVDDILVLADYPFRVSMNEVDKVFLYNFNSNVSYYDDIEIEENANCSNEITSGPVPIFMGTGELATTCETVVTYDDITPDSFTLANACGNVSIVSFEQTGGLGSGASFPVGVTTEQFLLTDNLGVNYNYSFAVTVTDTTPPIIECPSDLIVVTPNDAYTIEDYSNLVLDNCSSGSDLEITQNPPPGTIYEEGNEIDITLTAVDTTGNESICTFNLKVDSSLEIEEVEITNAITLFPNPAQDKLTINTNTLSFDKIEVYDLIGRLVTRFKMSKNLETINLARLNSGTYFLVLENEDQRIVRKFIRE